MKMMGIDQLIEEYRINNELWMRKGKILFEAGDLPGGGYFGPDKELFWTCLEIKAISWKFDNLRAKMKQAHALVPMPPEPHDLFKINEWNERSSEYFEFAEFSKPFFESCMLRLADLKPHTLHGLAAKARLISLEYFGGSSVDDTTGGKAVRSIFSDIRDLMGFDR